MNRGTRRPRLRPPSAALSRRARGTLTTLTLRTADDTASALDQPVLQQHPGGRFAIPPEKLEKALSLYANWKQAQALARLEAAGTASPSEGSFLAVPNASTVHSLPSGGSSRRNRGTSISTSLYEATDRSSVVSFDDIASTSTANTASRQLTAYDGTRVPQRTRRNFDTVGRAKVALVRWLGACNRCKARSVACSIEEHHDFATLDRLYQERRGEARAPRHRSRSSVSNISQPTTTSFGQHNAENPSSTSRNLFGIGQNERLLHPELSFSISHQELQSPGGFVDPLIGIVAPTHMVTDLSYGPTIQTGQPTTNTDSVVPYQNGGMLFIGQQDQAFYVCRYWAGCGETFEDPSELETHFSYAHLPITRLSPAIRYLCSHCFEMNNFPSGPCQSCTFQSTIQTWVCAQYFSMFTHQQDPGNGPAPMRYDPSAPYYPAAFPPHNTSNAWAPTPGPSDSNGNVDESNGNGASRDSFDNNLEPHGESENQDYEFFDFNGSDGGGQGYQGNLFRSARQMARKRSEVTDAIKPGRRRRFLLFLITFLLVTSILAFSYDWLVNEASIPSFRPHVGVVDELAIVGFIGIFASFGFSLFLQHTFVYLHSQQIISNSFRSFAPYSTQYHQHATPKILSSCDVHL